MKAWHFCRDDRRLRLPEDGRRIRTGRTLKVKGNLVLCIYGLHASINVLDALCYAQGDVICRVRLGGQIFRGSDKCVASERTALWTFKATSVLHEFACRIAERALRQYKVTDERSWNAITIKRRWIVGKASSTQLQAAWATASAAASEVAWAAAGAVARSAAEAAAEAASAAACAASEAAGVAARSAAEAASAAAEEAAWEAAREAGAAAKQAQRQYQERLLLRMVRNARIIS